MRFTRLAAIGGAAALASTALAIAAVGSAGAESDPGASSGPSGVTTVTVLRTQAAQSAAQAALDDCAAKGYAVTVSVVNRDGALLALLRNEQALPASVDSANGKAYASASFRQPSGNLGAAAANNPGLLQMPGFVVLRGGLPISSGGQVIGGIGVGGAPGGDIDEACAQAGITAIADHL
ncbi:MAG: heme-binding protein [Acidimicrobiales bacterium]